MTRSVPPLWTAQPSRFAGWPRGAALAVLALLALALWASATGENGGSPVDFISYAGAVEAMRHGADFHAALASSLRAGGGEAGLLGYPPPTLATLAAALPHLALAVAMFGLAAAVLLAWWPVMRVAVAQPTARWGAGLLLMGGLVPYLVPAALYLPESWAGLLVALSLAFHARNAWVEAAAFGLAAGVVREAAGVYALLMLLFAFWSGKRREVVAWALALGVLALAALAHWRAVRAEVGPVVALGDWTLRDLDPLLRAATEASPLAPLPVGWAAPVMALALFGWLAWRSPTGLRVTGAAGAVALLFAALPGLDPACAYLIAAPLLVGLAFVPDGLRDLLRAWRGTPRRRITVTRVVR